MANVTQLKHLEHLEDEMLNYGVEGCKSAVAFLQELRKMLGCDNSTGFMQTKWDGAPSLVCGKDPKNGLFFVGTKAVFNKDPKLCYSPDQIDRWYGDRADLATKLKLALQYFKGLGIDGVIQGDLLFTTGDLKTETVHGERLYTFRPNTITYGVPVDHDIGKRAKVAKIGIVFHTHYRGQDTRDIGQSELLENMSAKAGIGGVRFNNDPNVFIVDNDTPMDKVGLNHTEERTFDTHVASIEQKCKTCGDFLDELVKFSGTTGDDKWHVSSYVKQFFNAEIRERRNIANVDTAFEGLYNFYYDKTKAMLAKLKTNNTKVAKASLVHSSLNYLEDNKPKFKAMLDLYKELQEIKQFVIDKLDHLESFRTYVQTENGYKVTGPEGYVLHKDGDMIKFVNRLEFAYNNFTLQKQWR